MARSVIDIVFKEHGVDRVSRGLGGIGRGLTSVAGAATAAGAALGAMGVAGFLAARKLANEFSEYADQLDKASKRTGVAAQDLARLRHAADLSGASFGGLVNGLRFLARAADEAQQGTAEYAEVFDRLGVSVTDGSGQIRDLADLLPDLADAFAGLKSDTTAAALAQQAFGRGGLEILPMLREGSDAIRAMGDEADRLGLVLSQANVNAGVHYKDMVTDFEGAVKGMRMQVAQVLLPSMTQGAIFLTHVFEQNNPIDIWFHTLRTYLQLYRRAVEFQHSAALAIINPTDLDNWKTLLADMALLEAKAVALDQDLQDVRERTHDWAAMWRKAGEEARAALAEMGGDEGGKPGRIKAIGDALGAAADQGAGKFHDFRLSAGADVESLSSQIRSSLKSALVDALTGGADAWEHFVATVKRSAIERGLDLALPGLGGGGGGGGAGKVARHAASAGARWAGSAIGGAATGGVAAGGGGAAAGTAATIKAAEAAAKVAAIGPGMGILAAPYVYGQLMNAGRPNPQGDWLATHDVGSMRMAHRYGQALAVDPSSHYSQGLQAQALNLGRTPFFDPETRQWFGNSNEWRAAKAVRDQQRREAQARTRAQAAVDRANSGIAGYRAWVAQTTGARTARDYLNMGAAAREAAGPAQSNLAGARNIYVISAGGTADSQRLAAFLSDELEALQRRRA